MAWGIGKGQRTNDIRFPPSGNRWNYGQSIVPPGLTNVSAIGAGHYHSLAVVESGPPAFRSALVDRVVAQGITSYLYAPAVGARPLAYQWKRNGLVIPGATNALLTLAHSPLEDAGMYSVTVTNAFGTATSSEVRVEVAPFVIRLDHSKFLLGFPTVAGHRYFIQYSSNLSTWQTAQPPLTGTGAEVPWIDSGPPKTETHPSLEAKRFYRVLTGP